MKEGRGGRGYRRFWGSEPLAEAEEELAFHLELKREELRAAGVPESELEAELARTFGDRARIEGELRQIGRRRARRARRADLLDDSRVDLRHAWRSFVRRPSVPLVVVLSLALTIGAGTAVFSLFDAVVLNPLPVPRADELVQVTEDQRMGLAYPMVQHLRASSTTAAGVAGSVAQSVALRDGDSSQQLTAGLVTGDWFRVLGLRPQAGRLLVESDEASPGETPYVVLSDAVWRRAFDGDASVIGRVVAINEVPFTIVGVAPPRFRGVSLSSPHDLWLPLTMVGTVSRSGLFTNPEALTTWSFSVLDVIARIRSGHTPEASTAELRALHASALAARPEDVHSADGEPPVLTSAPLKEAAAARSREDLLRLLWMLVAAVVVAVAVACVNVANLMLMRSAERTREMSVRAAMGASRGRMLRQLLLESGALAALAGVLGIAVALLLMRGLATFSLPGGIALGELSLPLDARVLGFTALVSLLCAVAFGLAPAVAGARTDVMHTLRAGEIADRRRWRGGVLVGVQVALSVVLLVAGALFVRSVQHALSVDLGFRSEGVGLVSVGLRQHGYTEEQADLFITSVLEDAAARPGVRHAAAVTRAPLEAPLRMPLRLVDGAAEAPADMAAQFGRGTPTAVVQVTPGYLDALGIRLLRGRDVTWADRDGSTQVALVSESAARALWPGEDAVGRAFVVMFGRPFTVVGVVADANLSQLGDREPHVFLPLLQSKNLSGMDRLRLLAVGDDSGAAIAALRQAVRATDARLPTFGEQSVQRQMEAVLMPQRFGSMLLGGFGVLALIICAVGIYAVAAYDVTRRRRELGIRAALGAQPPALARTVLSRAVAAIVVGAIAGLVLAGFATRTIEALLFGVTPGEPVSYVVAALLLGVVAMLASWVPARRAAAVDPLTVIRG